MTAQRDANITLDSIWNGKWEIPGSQSGFFHGTPSLVGLLTQKLGEVAPTLTSRSKMVAGSVSRSKTVGLVVFTMSICDSL